MTKKMLGKMFVVIGIAFVTIAIGIFFHERYVQTNASVQSENAVNVIKQEMKQDIDGELLFEDIEKGAEELLIDGELYFAILEIPSLALELPIQSMWSYEKLKSSPCLYTSEPMVIAAHNYDVHFGRLGNLKVDDIVTLTLISGEMKEYEVVSVTKIHETDTEQLDDETYALSLFTCNYSNNDERILVRLQLVK